MKTSLAFLLPVILFQLIQLPVKGQLAECGSGYLHDQLMQNDAAYKEQFAILESQVQTILREQRSSGIQSAIYTIPVVVHVIHKGEAKGTGTNISDSTIQSTIDGLNYRYRNGSGIGVNTEIQFCLASRDPQGQATSGINRVNGSVLPRYASHGISMLYSNCDAPAEDSVKALSRWPVASYYNIWVVNRICQGFGNFLALTTYPNGGVNDGMVIISTAMTGTSSTVTHEIGHGFFLFHTFEGDGGNAYCPVNDDCSTDGDKVCDTPPHKQNDCGSSNPCTTAGTWTYSMNNYMSYCSLKNRFTPGQRDRMRAAAVVYPRASLITSVGCSLVGLEETADNDFLSIYPNPVSGKLILTAGSSIDKGTVEIYTLLGEKIINEPIYNGAKKEINVTNVAAGIYFVKVYDGQRQYCRKVIIN